MARRGQRFRAPPPGDPADPNSWRVIVDSYLLSLELRALSPATVYGRRRSLARFASWNIANQTCTPLAVDEQIVTNYQLHLHQHVSSTGHGLAPRTRQQYLIAVRGLYRWLRKTQRIEHDPTIDIELPKTPDYLPRNYLTVQQAESVLALPNLDTALGRRDRTMLEVLYATGIRRSELANIGLNDIDLEQRQLFINQGKGARDRLIPIGERATQWISNYLTDTRPLHIDRNTTQDALFITRNATPICTAQIGSIVAKYLRRAGFPTGNCHTFRHTTATLMLRGGADLRSIQAMLGHRNLASTQRYTHINIDHLTRVHAATHPSATTRPSTPPSP